MKFRIQIHYSTPSIRWSIRDGGSNAVDLEIATAHMMAAADQLLAEFPGCVILGFSVTPYGLHSTPPTTPMAAAA